MESNAEKIETVYVRLLNEGTDVMRPTDAVHLGQGQYRLLPVAGYDPEDEEWEFPPGSVVRCEKRRSSSSEYMLAVEE